MSGVSIATLIAIGCPVVHHTLGRFCALIYFILIVKVSIKQFQDSFVSCWPYSAFTQNLNGKRKRGLWYSSQSFLAHAMDNQRESAPPHPSCKEHKNCQSILLPIASNTVQNNIKMVLLENFAKITNVTFSKEYHSLRLTGVIHCIPVTAA